MTFKELQKVDIALSLKYCKQSFEIPLIQTNLDRKINNGECAERKNSFSKRLFNL